MVMETVSDKTFQLTPEDEKGPGGPEGRSEQLKAIPHLSIIGQQLLWLLLLPDY